MGTNEASIVFRGEDRVTTAARMAQKSIGQLRTDLDKYKIVERQAFAKRSDVGLDLTKAREELKKYTKEMKTGGTDAEEHFKRQSRLVDELAADYRKLGETAKTAGRAEMQLREELSLRQNSTPISTPTSGGGGDITKQLMSVGLGSIAGNALGNFMNVGMSSAYGTNIGNTIGGVVSGAITGAMMGSVGGAPGAVVGGLVGAGAGLLNGATTTLTAKDDVFREQTSSLHGQMLEERRMGLTSGIAMQTERELQLSGLSTMLGSEKAGSKMFESLKKYGIDTPYETSGIINSANQMMAYGVAPEDLIGNISMLGDIARGDQNKLNSLSYAYSQTQSLGKLSGQDKLQYTAAGFNPLQYLVEDESSDFYGKTLGEMDKLMSEGKILASHVTRAMEIATSEGGKFYGATDAMMETYGGKMSMLTDLHKEIDIGYGDGYTQKRTQGMDKEIQMLEGETGKQMKEAYSLIGEYEADLENQHQESIMTAMTAAMETEEYQKAMAAENGAEMGGIIAQAKAEAEIEHNNSSLMAQKYESELGLIGDIQDRLRKSGAYLDFGYQMGQEFSKGFTKGFSTIDLPITNVHARGDWESSGKNQLVQSSQSADFTANRKTSGVNIGKIIIQRSEDDEETARRVVSKIGNALHTIR